MNDPKELLKQIEEDPCGRYDEFTWSEEVVKDLCEQLIEMKKKANRLAQENMDLKMQMAENAKAHEEQLEEAYSRMP